MKPIEGIDLAAIYDEEQNEILFQKKKTVFAKVRGMIRDLDTWKFQLGQKYKEIEKLKKKIDNAELSLEKVRNGDFSVILDGDKQEAEQ